MQTNYLGNNFSWVKFKLRKYTPYGEDLIRKRTELCIVDKIGKEKDFIYGFT